MNQLINNNARNYCDLCGECGARDIGPIIREDGKLFICNDDLCWWVVRYMSDGPGDRDVFYTEMSDADDKGDIVMYNTFNELITRTKRYEEVMGEL